MKKSTWACLFLLISVSTIILNSCKRKEVPVLTTEEVSHITPTTAITGGNISYEGSSTVIARGVCWSISSNPTIVDNTTSDSIGAGSFKSKITDLMGGTTYFVKAYATNNEGTGYGSEISFLTQKTALPVLTTLEISNITATSATSGGNITDEGSSPVIAHGVCWSTSSNPVVINNKTTGSTGTGNFVSNISGLTPNTNYFVRAYATNNEGTGYGKEVSFKTDPSTVPIITTSPVNSIGPISAESGGTISSDGAASITIRGICWSTAQYPTISDNKTSDGSGLGAFTSSMTGLTHSTTYYVRAYATNTIGTGYGDTITFQTLSREALFNPNMTYGSVSDIEGNVYKTVNIGTQIWMAENLKTTKYKDGTAIPLVTDNTAWALLRTPGYCWYKNNSANKDTYGGLYNWYAVNTGNLCPVGWHVSSSFKGYNYDGTTTGGNIAKSLASSSGWKSSSITGTVGNTDYPAMRNATGFTALPGGLRQDVGTFSDIGSLGGWGSADLQGALILFQETVVYSFPNFFLPTDYIRTFGFSVRCVKD